MGSQPEAVRWTEIPIEEATGLRLPMKGVIGPVNEMGEPCPWPWDPPQLAGAPIGQYRCPYCFAMVIAGMDHLDYRTKSGRPWLQDVEEEIAEEASSE